MSDDDAPTFEASKWESAMHFCSSLVRMPETDFPFWIRFGNTRMKIDFETRHHVTRGLMIAYEFEQLTGGHDEEE